MSPLLLLLWMGCRAPEIAQTCEDFAQIPTSGTTFIYDHSSVQNMQISLSSYEMAKLATMPDQELDDVSADITINGMKFSNVGLKLKGHASFRTIEEKASFKVDLHQFNSNQTLNGMKRFNLNSMIQDPAKISENIGYFSFQEMGLISPRQGYTCISVNGVNYGLYSIIEALDEQFVSNNFSDDSGVLYEGSGFDLNKNGIQNFELQEGHDPDRQYLTKLVTDLSKTTNATYWSFVETHFNPDELMMAFALLTYMGNRDTYLTWKNNYYMYYEPSSEKWTFLPWGMDQLFDESLLLEDPLIDRPDPGVLFTKCLQSSECTERFYDQMDEVNQMIADGSLQEYMQMELDRIYTLSRQDPMDEVTSLKVHGDSNDSLDFLEERMGEYYLFQ